MAIKSDWHIHTNYSWDCAQSGSGVKLKDLKEAAASQGIEQLGVTDHVNSVLDWEIISQARQEFELFNLPPNIHFGVEVSCVSEWELAEVKSGRRQPGSCGIREGGPEGTKPALPLEPEDIEKYKIEYVVAGVHWPHYVKLRAEPIIRNYQRQNMFLATHPLVSIVAHPWWWSGHWQDAGGMYLSDPWLDDFGKIPWSMHDEFAAAVKENGKAVEINLLACLFNSQYTEDFIRQYLDYLAYLYERQVKLSIGSDSHGPEYELDFAQAEDMLAEVGIDVGNLWTLEPKD